MMSVSFSTSGLLFAVRCEEREETSYTKKP